MLVLPLVHRPCTPAQAPAAVNNPLRMGKPWKLGNKSWKLGNKSLRIGNKSLRIGNTAAHMPFPKASFCNWHKPAKHSRTRRKQARTKHMSLAHDTSGTHSRMASCPDKLWHQIISLLLVHEAAQATLIISCIDPSRTCTIVQLLHKWSWATTKRH